MKANQKVLLATFGLIFVATCLLLFWDPLVGVAAPTATGEAPAGGAEVVTAGSNGQATTGQRLAAADNKREIAVAEGPQTSVTPKARLVVNARCVDGAGKPVRAAYLTASQVVGTPKAFADDDGKVQLTVEWPTELLEGNRHFLVVQVSGDGLTRYTEQLSVDSKIVAAKEVQTFSLGDVVLEAGGGVAGVVQDVDGTPLKGARIWIASAITPAQGATEERRGVFGRGFSGLGRGIWAWTESDGEGRYRLAGLPVGSASVVARHPGRLCGYTAPIAIVAGQEVAAPTLRLLPVPEENLVRGWVRDEGGNPLPGAYVSVFANRGPRNIDPQTSTSAKGPDGAFEVVVMSNERYTLEAKKRGSRGGEVLLHDVPAGTKDVVVQFVRGKAFQIGVTGPGGVPVARPSVTAHDERGGWLEIDSSSPEAGLLELSAPSQKFRLWVRAPGYLAKSLGPFEPKAVPQRLEVELTREGSVSGTVLADGKPVVGAQVHLHFLNERTKFRRFAHKVYTRLEKAMRGAVQTDAAGRFTLPVRRPGQYVIHAVAEGHAQGESADLTLAPTTRSPAVEVVLTKAAAIVGRVITGPARSSEGQIVAATRGDGHVEVCVSDKDGGYHFEGLMPGGWQVRVCRPDDQRWLQQARSWPDRSIEELPVDVQLFAGQTATYDVDLRGLDGAEIRGRLALDGVVCAGWRASLWRDGEYLITKLGADGTFTQRGAVGKTTIHFFGKLPAGGQLQVRQALTLVEGVNPVDVALKTGGVDLLALPPPAKPPEEDRPEGYALVWSNDSGPRFVYRFDADASGNHRVPALPVGSVQLRRREDDRTHVEGWKVIAEFTITAGQHVQVTPKK